MDLVSGIKIRDYKIIKKIGIGGMGEVFLATDEMLDRKIAIKVLSPELMKNSLLVERFKTEAKIQATLNHPNIVTLYAFFEESGNYFMVMEFAEGITLKEQIKDNGGINDSRIKNILLQIFAGLQFAHQKGIVHRDIKPSNIIIDKNDNAKIMDFGIAKILDDKELTSTGVKMGTVYYMSPEIINADKDVDSRTDIYSLGITLYEMLTGKVPFNVTTQSDFKVMCEIMNGNIVLPESGLVNTNQNLIKLMYLMCHKDKNQRISSIADCITLLNEEPDKTMWEIKTDRNFVKNNTAVNILNKENIANQIISNNHIPTDYENEKTVIVENFDYSFNTEKPVEVVVSELPESGTVDIINQSVVIEESTDERNEIKQNGNKWYLKVLKAAVIVITIIVIILLIPMPGNEPVIKKNKLRFEQNSKLKQIDTVVKGFEINESKNIKVNKDQNFTKNNTNQQQKNNKTVQNNTNLKTKTLKKKIAEPAKLKTIK